MKWNAWAISSNKYICWTKFPFYFVSSNCKFSSQIENFEKHNLEEGHPGHSQHRMKYTPGVHQSQVFEESLPESSTKKVPSLYLQLSRIYYSSFDIVSQTRKTYIYKWKYKWKASELFFRIYTK